MPANAFVLAAGFGTRLRPLTNAVPKPLVPVCGVPMLSYALRLCAQHGLQDVIVNAHYLAEQLMPWAGVREGCRVEISVEHPEILGTGGGLRRVTPRLAERFAVVNADILNDVDLTALLAAVPPNGGALALRPHPDIDRYGIVAADTTGRIVEMKDIARAVPEGAVLRDTHFSGVHAMDRRLLEEVPDGFSCIVRTAYKERVPRRLIGSIRHTGTWLDVGDPQAYLEANLAVLSGALAVPLDPFARAGWSAHGGDDALVARAGRVEDSWIGPEVALGAGCRIFGSVVGKAAVVPSDTVLSSCVVWDGVQVPPGTHTRRVFTGHSES